MKREIYLELKVTDENNELFGRIGSYTLEGLQEQMHKIENVVEDNAYVCDTCGESYKLEDLIETAEDTHICGGCNEAEPLPTQQDLE